MKLQKKLLLLAVFAMGAGALYAKCACPGDRLTGAPSWAPAPLRALTFETGGDAKWAADKTVTNHEGKVSTVLRSGAIGADQKTWMQARVKGNGRLSFWWKSSCEENNDKLSFEVRSVCEDPEHCKCGEDDTVPCDCHGDCQGGGRHRVWGDTSGSGTNEWTNVIVDITDGQKYEDILDADGKKTGVKTNLVEHIVRWTYSKNASLNRFEDCGWVDDAIWARSLERDVTVTFDPNGGQFEGSVDTKPTFKFEMDDAGNIQPYYRDHTVQSDDGEVTVVDTRFPTNEIKKARFEFKGWYADLKDLASRTSEWNEVSPTNITLHAMWRQIESDPGVGLFEALDLDQVEQSVLKQTFRDTLTTNDWLACRKGGIDDGDMAMSGKASATFSTVVTNHTGTVGGADGAFSFWWKREYTNSFDTMKVKWEGRKGIWCDGEVMSNGVMIAGFTPRWVAVSDSLETREDELKEMDRKDDQEEEDDPNAAWNFKEFPTTVNNCDEDVRKPYSWTEGGVTFSSSNCHKRVMFRKFSCTFTSSSDLHHGYVDRLVWTPIKEVKVTFDANGGTVSGKATYRATYPAGYVFDFEGVDSNLVSNAFVTNKTAVGSKFRGWYDKQTGGTRLATGEAIPCTTSNLTYYAHWQVSIADAIGQPGLDIGATPCCEDDKAWSGTIGDCPSNATSAAWCKVPGAGEMNSFWFTVSGEKFLSFRWFMENLTGNSFDLFSVWVDGEMVAQYGYRYDVATQTWVKDDDFNADDWNTFYYYLKSGQHEIRVNYAAGEGGDTTGYLTELELAKVDAKDLIDWLDKLHCYGTWVTNKLGVFAAKYEKDFGKSGTAAYRARLGHALCTVLALGENPEVIAAAYDNGTTIVEHYPFVATNFLNYVFGDYAPEEVIAHLNAIKGSTPNEHYERFSREAVAALNTAIADLDAITNGWKGSFLLETTGKRIDMSGVACTNDLAVDLADINMIKANLQGMLSSVQFVGAHDMTIDYDAVITSLTSRPRISRMPQMQDPQNSQHNPIWAKRLLKATAENPLLDEDERARLSAYIVKTYGDGTDWDNVPALPLKSAPYAEIERSGSVKIAMCGGVSISAPPPPSNANRLMFLVESNEREERLAGKVIRATFIDEISGRPIVIRIALPAAPPAAPVEPVIQGGYNGVTIAGYTPAEDLLHRQGGFALGDVQIYSDNGEDSVTVVPGLEYFGTVAQITLDLANCTYGEYFPVHWTIHSVEVGTDTVNFNNAPAFLVGEHAAPSMTGNSNEWRNVRTYRISPLNAAPVQVPGVVAESIQFVRNSSNVYFRLSRLNPQSRHTFESVHLTLTAQPEIDPAGSGTPATLNFDNDIDTTKVVFTGDSVEFSVALPPEYDSAKLNQMTLTDLRCSCCAEDDDRLADHPEENALTPFSSTDISVDEEMRWHSVRTHYEDFGTVLAEHPNFLKNLRDAALLASSKESMRAALTSFIAADAAMQVRKDEARHIFTYTNGVAEALADVRQAARDALLSLDGPQKVNFLAFRKAFRLINGGLFDRYLGGPGFRDMFVPEAMSYVLNTLDLRLEGDVAMDMGVLFKSGLSRSLLPQFDGAWPVLDTLPDPTFGGIFPGMTLADWLGSYLGLGIISLDTYLEAYPQMAVKVPTHLKIRQYVQGEGYVNYITDLRAAMPGARISCAVDGIDQAVTEFAPSHVNCGVWIRGKGEHEVVWTIISGPLVEVGRDGRSVPANESWLVDALWNNGGNKYGEYWTIAAGGVAESFWPYRQNNTFIPIVAIEFSEGLKLISKRRSGGSIDFGFDDDEPFVAGVATAFRGELLTAGALVGTVTVKVDKKGVVSAEIKYADGRKESYKKGILDSEGKVEFEGGLTLTLGQNKLSGALPGETYEIAGARDVFSSKVAEDKAKASEALAKWQRTYVLAMEAIDPEKDPMANGFATFSIAVGKGGKSKVQGYLPDGTKVSYSGQLILGEKDAHLPLAVTLKKSGNFGMDVAFGEDAAVSVAGSTGWMLATGAVIDWSLAASGLAEAAAPTAGQNAFMLANDFAFAMNCCTNALPTELRPESVMSAGGKLSVEKAAKVTYAGDWAIDTNKGSNLSSLKLAYKAATAALGGSFKVYVLENMKMKALKATVNGVSVDGVGYGSAVIKGHGSAPVVLFTPEDEP